MYIPDIYLNENQTEINAFLQENVFAILINQDDNNLLATHLPLFLRQDNNGKTILEGHMAKANPAWHSFDKSPRVLAVFSGPHSYISSSWYDHENVPTWNYIAVHIYGTVKIVNKNKAIEALSRLVDKYEKNSKKPVKVENFSKETRKQVNGIVAFEIEIQEIQAVKKMSQNRDDKNYKNIITELEATQNPQSLAVANEMQKNRK